MFQFLDDAKLLEKFPIFVSAKPNAMPSENIEEGDLQTVISMIEVVRDSLSNIFDKISNLSFKNNEKFNKLVDVVSSVKNDLPNIINSLPINYCDSRIANYSTNIQPHKSNANVKLVRIKLLKITIYFRK